MRVLVTCTGNTCRSPMAAGLLKAIAESRGLLVEVRSAGLTPHPGQRAAHNAVTTMAEIGVDISQEFSKPVTPDILQWADLILAIQRSHADHLVEDFPQIASKVRFLGVHVRDPYCGTVPDYREVRDIINRLLLRFIDSGGLLDKGPAR